MYLHNKLEIIKNGTTKVFYNKLLKKASVSIQNLENYFNFLSLGSGSSPTDENTAGLEALTASFPLSLTSYNIDRSFGDLYITKSVTVTNPNAFSFSEVGVSAYENSSDTINRFVLSEPMVYTPEEGLTINVTIYLEVGDGDDSSFGFMAGENYLIGLILGHNFNGETAHKFTACAGVNKAGSSEVLVYEKMPDAEFDVVVEPTVVDGSGAISFSSVLSTRCGAPETIVGMDGVPVFRYSNYNYPNSTTTAKTYTGTVDKGMSVKLSDRYVKSIDQVLDTTTNTIVIDTQAEPFGSDLGNINYSPFGEFDYSAETKRFVSHDGKAIAFLVDGRLDYYILEYGYLKKLDASVFDNENFEDLKIFYDIIISRYYNEAEDKHYTKYYYLKDGRFVEGSITIPWGSSESEVWRDLDLNICNAENSYIIGFITSTDTFMGYLVRDDVAGTMTGTLFYTIGKPLDIFRVTGGSRIEDAYGAGFCKDDETLGVYVLRSTGTTFFTKSGAKDLFNKYGCDVQAYNGFFYGVYNEKILSTSCRVLMFCDSLNYSSSLLHYTHTDKIYWSEDGRYLIAQDSDGVNFRYYTFAKTSVVFDNIISNDVLPVDSIADIVGLSNLTLVFRKNSEKTISFPVIENYVSVSPMTVGNKVQVSYTTLDLVGENGEINMQASCKIVV